MKIQEVWVDRGDLRRTRVVDATLPEPAEGEILVAIESLKRWRDQSLKASLRPAPESSGQ